MGKCENCIHKEVCEMSFNQKEKERHPEGKDLSCDHFADVSEMIKLPCKVGDMVYLLRKDTGDIEVGYVQHFIKYMHSTAANIRLESGRNSIISNIEFGRILFLTKEDALAELERLEGKK